MLLLLKQARAFGCGVVLATQNPVDLDYKGLSNIGTWFVGRLQTTQDQDRVIDGIVGASDGSLNRTRVRELLSDMKGRQFLLTSAHLDEPLLFETRWVMSYLKGPISLQDIATLMKDRPVFEEAEDHAAGRAAASDGTRQGRPPILSEGVEQRFHLLNMYAEEIAFEPWLAATATVRFYNASRNIDEETRCSVRLYLDDSFKTPRWDASEPLESTLPHARTGLLITAPVTRCRNVSHR